MPGEWVPPARHRGQAPGPRSDSMFRVRLLPYDRRSSRSFSLEYWAPSGGPARWRGSVSRSRAAASVSALSRDQEPRAPARGTVFGMYLRTGRTPKSYNGTARSSSMGCPQCWRGGRSWTGEPYRLSVSYRTYRNESTGSVALLREQKPYSTPFALDLVRGRSRSFLEVSDRDFLVMSASFASERTHIPRRVRGNDGRLVPVVDVAAAVAPLPERNHRAPLVDDLAACHLYRHTTPPTAERPGYSGVRILQNRIAMPRHRTGTEAT